MLARKNLCAFASGHSSRLPIPKMFRLSNPPPHPMLSVCYMYSFLVGGRKGMFTVEPEQYLVVILQRGIGYMYHVRIISFFLVKFVYFLGWWWFLFLLVQRKTHFFFLFIDTVYTEAKCVIVFLLLKTKFIKQCFLSLFPSLSHALSLSLSNYLSVLSISNYFLDF